VNGAWPSSRKKEGEESRDGEVKYLPEKRTGRRGINNEKTSTVSPGGEKNPGRPDRIGKREGKAEQRLIKMTRREKPTSSNEKKRKRDFWAVELKKKRVLRHGTRGGGK